MVKRNVTIEQVAQVCEVTPRAVRFWIAGEREPKLTIKQVKGLCRLFRCSVHSLPDRLGPNQVAPTGPARKG